MAVEIVVAREAENSRATPTFGEPQPDVSERTNRLASAIHLANHRRYSRRPASILKTAGMGATVVAAWIDGQRLSVAHVGDIRIYLLRAGSLDQLTADHSLVAEKVRCGMTPQEAETSELQSVLTRAVGSSAAVDVDANEQMLLAGDMLLLCSDGLTRMVTDPEIASTLLTTTSPQAAADRLIELANENGGVDNVSVIVVHITQKSESVLDRLKIWKRNSA